MGGEQRSRSEEKRIQVRVRCASPSARVGLIKKASELSILCGTHVGIIVFLAGKEGVLVRASLRRLRDREDAADA